MHLGVFSALFFLSIQSSALATGPSDTKSYPEHPLCRESRLLEFNPPRSCDRLREILQRAEVTQELSDASRAALRPEARNINADRGAQCEFFTIANSAAQELRTKHREANSLLSDLRGIKTELERYLTQEYARLRALADGQMLTRVEASQGEMSQLREAVTQQITRLEARVRSLEQLNNEALSMRADIQHNYRCSTELAADPRRVRAPAAGETGPQTTLPGQQAPLTEVERRLRDNTVRLSQPGDDLAATGFYANTGIPGQRVTNLLTAEHVVARDFHSTTNFRHDERDIAPAGDVGGQARVPLQSSFPMQPGLYDRGNDVVASPQPPGGPAGLDISPAGSRPEEGQQFIIAGHPAFVHNNEYVNMSCSFLGYARENGHYVLDCPTGNSFIGGMSGGPVVDSRTGQVWGVITQQGATRDLDSLQGQDVIFRDNRVFVTPVHLGADGELQIGQRQIFNAERCYGQFNNPARPCQVGLHGMPSQPLIDPRRQGDSQRK